MKLHTLAFLLALAALPARAATDQDAIAAVGESFVESFNKGDAAALAAAWQPDGAYTDVDGRTYRGRAEIEKAFQQFFATTKGAQLRVDSDSLRLPASGVAIEQGTSSVSAPGGQPPSRARYTNVFAKTDGKWLLADVQEAPFVAPDRSAELGALTPLLGKWVAQTKSGETIRASVTPAPGGNFVVIDRVILQKDVPVSGGTEWIAWDPAAKRIRSWSFESDGGFSESAWSQNGDKWTVAAEATLRDGRKVKETHTLAVTPDGTLTVSSTDLALDDKSQAPTDALTFKRPN
jgi:uncharacterized protein (TIGR02246 family)